MADYYSYEMVHGDVIVSASDGVLDNLFNYEILKLVKDFKAKYPNLHTVEQADVI